MNDKPSFKAALVQLMRERDPQFFFPELYAVGFTLLASVLGTVIFVVYRLTGGSCG